MIEFLRNNGLNVCHKEIPFIYHYYNRRKLIARKCVIGGKIQHFDVLQLDFTQICLDL